MEKDYFELNENKDRLLEEKITELLELCKIYDLPAFFTIAVKNTASETVYHSAVNGVGSHNRKLANDQIRKHILISNGFEILKQDEENLLVPPRDKKRVHVKVSHKEDDADAGNSNNLE